MAAATARGSGNLPAEVTSLVGRRRELSVLKQVLTSTRLVTLTGPGGVGKTRLALRLAAEVRRAFADGVWLVELAALEDPQLLAHTAAGALGLRDGSKDPSARLSEYVRDRRLLLVLDNCEHLLDRCASLVVDLLRASRTLCIVTTSRHVLNVAGEQAFPVAPLSAPRAGDPVSARDLYRFEAVRLLVERGESAIPGFAVNDANSEAVVRLCRRLDGLPLAIELAAVSLRSLTVKQLADRLEDRFRVLNSGLHGMLPRQQTLRATIDWSFDLCSPGERELWTRCSVFAESFDLEAAENVCSGRGIATGDVLGLVTGLVDKSVLSREESGDRARYRFLEALSQYGREKLSDDRDHAVAVRARHGDYYLALVRQAEAERFGPHHGEWLARLLSEHANLRAALESCLGEPDRAQHGLELAAALETFWIQTGLHDEGRRWLERALASAPEVTAARAEALSVYGWLNFWLGDIDRALRFLTEARSAAERLGEDAIAARAMLYLSIMGLQRDEASAFASMRASLDRVRDTGDTVGTWVALIQLALAACVLRRPDAQAYALEALSLCRKQAAHFFRSHTLPIAALASLQQGDLRQVLALTREALDLKSDQGDPPWGIAQCLGVLAHVACAEDQHEKAARLLGAAQTLWTSGGTPVHLRVWWLRSFYIECEQRAREELGDKKFAALHAEGARLAVDEAISYALNERTQAPQVAPEPSDLIEPLTPREREVAALVAKGLSNKEIAHTLVIAQRTTEGHVENILRKLGFTSRAQIATWVTERAKRQ